MLTSYGTSKNM